MIDKRTLPIAALAIAALAVPAAASASNEGPFPYPLVPVPAGEVQHTVTETTFQSNVTVPGTTPWKRIVEIWDGTDASRSIVTDGYTGELLDEDIGTPSSSIDYNAERNALVSRSTDVPGFVAPPVRESWGTEGGKIRLQIAAGSLRPTGTTTFLGRPANTYVGPAEGGQVRYVIDAATNYPLEEAVSGTYGKQTFTQVSTVTAFESLNPAAAAADLASRSHPGATTSRVKTATSSKRKSPKRHHR